MTTTGGPDLISPELIRDFYGEFHDRIYSTDGTKHGVMSLVKEMKSELPSTQELDTI
jgi:hypothetical protein